MKNDSDVGSIMLADVGSVSTKVALFDVVDGTYRFIAGGRVTTSGHPSQTDFSRGIERAIRQIEAATGHRLTDNGGVVSPELADGVGVDQFGVTTSCRGPLRVMAIGTMDEETLTHALQGVYSAAVNFVDVLAWPSLCDQSNSPLSVVIEHICRLQPEGLLLVGGLAGQQKVTELSEMLMAIGPQREHGLPVVFSGDRHDSEMVTDLLRGKYAVQCVPSLLNDDSGEAGRNVEQRLSGLWSDSVLRMSSFSRMRPWLLMPTAFTSQSLCHVTRFLASHRASDVWCLDVGSTTTSLFAMVRGELLSLVKDGLGIGGGATDLHEYVETIRKWLPMDMSEAAVCDALMNKRLRPWTIPQSPNDALFEVAMARQAVRLALDNEESEAGLVRPLLDGGLVVGCGAVIANAPTDSAAALNLLNILEPAGVFELAIDRLALLPMLGALGVSFPAVAAQVLLADGLHRLGICVVPEGTLGGASNAVTITIERKDSDSQERVVPCGVVETIPLGPNERVSLLVQPHKNLDVGVGKGQPVNLEVRGGSLGIIIDTRGRPIAMPSAVGERWSMVNRWRGGLEGKP